MSALDMPTARAVGDHLTALGVLGAAAEAILLETAPGRHERRVAAAIEAAVTYYGGVTDLDTDEFGMPIGHPGIAAILLADHIGIGGRDGVEGLGTARHPAFRACGTGRKRARDGGAWSAAIAHALVRVSGEGVILRPDGEGLILDVRGTAYGGYVQDLIPARWLLSIAREGLRRSVGLAPWHLCRDDDPVRWLVEWDGPPAEWGALVQRALVAEYGVRAVDL